MASPRRIARLDRNEIENIIRDYLLKNPELLLDVQQALETKQREEQRVANLRSDRRLPRTRSSTPPMTATSATRTARPPIVEFYDYNCGYCKRARRTCWR